MVLEAVTTSGAANPVRVCFLWAKTGDDAEISDFLVGRHFGFVDEGDGVVAGGRMRG